jgi:hypothetical protein
VRLEGLVKLKNSMISSGIEPATFQFVALKCAVNKGLLNILIPQGYYIKITKDYTGRTICT